MGIATDKAFFSSGKCWYLSYFSMKTYVVGTSNEYPQHMILWRKICCGYSLEVPQRGASNEYPQRMFSWRNKKNIMWILSVAMDGVNSHVDSLFLRWSWFLCALYLCSYSLFIVFLWSRGLRFRHLSLLFHALFP